MRFLSTIIFCFLWAAQTNGDVQFRIKNNGNDQIWVGIQGGGNTHPHLEGGGFELNGNQETTISSPDNWEGRFWARTGCSNNQCETGDCGNGLKCGGNGGRPPATLAEIKLKGDAGLDYYDISLVDGFNVKASIQPIEGQGDCPNLGCESDINADCPEDLKLNVNGNTVGCQSSCTRFNTDQYCCRNAYGQPETCNINDWPVKSAQYFKDKCPDAYSYAYDDKASLKTCKASTYLITFG